MTADKVQAIIALVALVGAVVLFKLWANDKEARDPEFATKVERARAHMQKQGAVWGPRFLLNRAVWVVGAIGALAVNSAIEKYAPVLHWSDQQKMMVFLAAIAVLIILGIVIDGRLSRWMRARGLIRS